MSVKNQGPIGLSTLDVGDNNNKFDNNRLRIASYVLRV